MTLNVIETRLSILFIFPLRNVLSITNKLALFFLSNPD